MERIKRETGAWTLDGQKFYHIGKNVRYPDEHIIGNAQESDFRALGMHKEIEVLVQRTEYEQAIENYEQSANPEDDNFPFASKFEEIDGEICFVRYREVEDFETENEEEQ